MRILKTRGERGVKIRLGRGEVVEEGIREEEKDDGRERILGMKEVSELGKSMEEKEGECKVILWTSKQ